jgi:hypothetical protein
MLFEAGAPPRRSHVNRIIGTHKHLAIVLRHRMATPRHVLASDRVDEELAKVRRLVADESLSMAAAYEPDRYRTSWKVPKRFRGHSLPSAPLMCSTIQPATCARELNPGLVRMCSRWLSTVRSDRKRRSAMARLVIARGHQAADLQLALAQAAGVAVRRAGAWPSGRLACQGNELGRGHRPPRVPRPVGESP